MNLNIILLLLPMIQNYYNIRLEWINFNIELQYHHYLAVDSSSLKIYFKNYML